MLNHHGQNLSDFRTGMNGTSSLCLVQSLFLQAMVAKAERDLTVQKVDDDRKEAAVRLAYERNLIRE